MKLLIVLASLFLVSFNQNLHYCNDYCANLGFKGQPVPFASSLESTQRKIHYSQDEMMELASKFFYCEEVLPDTTVITHICASINGTYELKWTKKYDDLANFCSSTIIKSWYDQKYPIGKMSGDEKNAAIEKYKPTMLSLDQYLIDVRRELMQRMRQNNELRQCLLENYQSQKSILNFVISDKK